MRKLSLVITLTILIFGCVPQKDTLYLQGISNESKKEFDNVKSLNTIKVADQIYIQVNSFDDGNINFMNSNPNRYGGGRSEADLAMVSYTVDQEGNVKLPILGKSAVAGLTTEQAAEKIRQELEAYLNTPSVKISFVNKSVTVLGNVNRPGRYFYASEYLNVFQAIGLAGDITEYGNRKKVVLVRDQENKVVYASLDLTDINLLGNKELYLEPNDVIYVEPLKRRHWGFNSFPWAIVLSAVTTFVLVANYVE